MSEKSDELAETWVHHIDPSDHLAIGDVMRRTGVSASALHFYERKGLISSARTSSNQRLYQRHMLRRISLVLVAKRLGIQLADVARVFSHLPTDNAPTHEDWQRVSRAWKRQLEERRRQIEVLERELTGCIGCGCLSMKACALLNPDDALGAQGPGPVRIETQQPGQSRSTLGHSVAIENSGERREMNDAHVLRGLTTISFWADDLEAARSWYTRFLGVEPYFVRPLAPAPAAYVEFRIGDHQHELGIIDRSYAPPGAATTPGGSVVYWHVDDLQGTYSRLLSMGAKEYQPPTEREEGFVTAAVVDPFGNVLGVMYNPHYLDVLDAATGREMIGG